MEHGPTSLIQFVCLLGRSVSVERHGLVHAKHPYEHKALCGATPGRLSGGWSRCLYSEISCPRCRRSFAAKVRREERQRRAQSEREEVA